MNELDDFFKRNLSNDGFEYKDSYWGEMENLLDQKNKKKPFGFLRKSLVYFMFFLVSLTVISGLIGYHTLNFNKSPLYNQISQNTKLTENKSKEQFQTAQKNDRQKTENVDLKNVINPPVNKRLPNFSENNTNSFPVNEKNQETHFSTVNKSTLPSENLLVSSIIKHPAAIIGLKLHPNFELLPVTEILEVLIQQKTPQKHQTWCYSIGAGYVFNNYDHTKNQLNNKNQEKPINRSGYSIYLVGSYKWLGFKTGISSLKLSEVTNYITIKDNYTFYTSYKMVNPNFGTTPGGTRIAIIKREIDTVITSTTEVLNPNSVVDFTYLSLPFMTSIQWKYGRFKLFADAGIQVSGLISRKGNYTTLDGNEIKIVDSKTSSDFNSFLYQTLANIGLKYKIGNSYNIFTSYGYTYTLNSMVKSYIQKPQINSFSMGIEINL